MFSQSSPVEDHYAGHQECCQQCEEEAFPFLICWSSVSSVGLGEGGQEEEGGVGRSLADRSLADRSLVDKC